MCAAGASDGWNHLVGDTLHSESTDLTFIEASSAVDWLHLPSGAPNAKRLRQLQDKGVEGWIIASRGRTVAVVGPTYGRHFSFLNYSDYIALDVEQTVRASDSLANDVLERINKVSQAHSEGVLFVMIGDSLGKWLITEAFGTFAAKDSFIDVGSALDGYAGIEPREIARGAYLRNLCNIVDKYVSPDGIERHWMGATQRGARVNICRDPKRKFFPSAATKQPTPPPTTARALKFSGGEHALLTNITLAGSRGHMQGCDFHGPHVALGWQSALDGHMLDVQLSDPKYVAKLNSSAIKLITDNGRACL